MADVEVTGEMHAQVVTEDDVAAAKAAMEAADAGVETPETPEVPAEPPAEETPTEEPETLELSEEDPVEENAVEADGELIDISTFAAEFNSEEGPSDETRQMLVDALSTKFANAEALVDQFVAGQQAQGQAATQAAFDLVGGSDNYAAMQAWATENLPVSEREVYNQALNTPGMQQMAIRGLHAQFTAATGGAPDNSPQRVAPTGNVAGGVEPLVSLEQIAAATADPRFDRDPAYRQSVERRIAAGMKR
tara:strand:+ start:3567 stop:4313 length:747 start_codon:yes stop_codon:yes gene_type:complete